MANQGGYGIEEIYRGVIGDVVNQVREAFLDEGVDIEVLQQLKRSWELKIQASGAVDLENRQPLPALQPLKHARQQTVASISSAPSQPPPMPENVQGTSSSSNRVHVLQQQMASESQTVNPVQLLSLPAQMLASGSGLQLQPGMLPGTQYAIIDGPNGAPSLVLLNTQQLSLETQAQFLLQQQQPDNSNATFRRQAPAEVATKKEPSSHVPQLDGGGLSSLLLSPRNDARMEKKSSKHMKNRIPQVDGGGPGMMDSSSEEEPEEDDPLNRYAGLEDDPGEKEGDPEDDEEPLNSGDDQSDDEDLDTLFDADNVVVCQFEKVHRARNKWKFNLKDGVMQIKGKDYCFHKSNGEAEW